MEREISIAVLGATGLVGETIIEILAERDFPVENLYPLASHRSAGKTVNFKGKMIEVEDVDTFDFSKVELALFSAGGSVSAKYAPIAAENRCIVIDNTSHFRYDDDIPLVISEVNPEAIGDYTKRNIIANPNCSTMQMLVALKPIHDAVGIERVNVATYQAVSGAGKQAMAELIAQTGQLLNGKPAESKIFSQQMAFNVLPQIDVFQDNDYTKEEMKMVWETQKILADPNIKVNPTAVRVPVFYGHAEAVHLETRDKISPEEVKDLLNAAPGVEVIDDPAANQYPTPMVPAVGKDAVYVGRIREDISHPKGIDMWIVSDNVRKGAALNAVQIAEIVHREYL